MKASPILIAAVGYIKQGFSPVPIPFRGKGPTISEWQRLRITEKDLAKVPERQRDSIKSSDTYNEVTTMLKTAASLKGKQAADIVDDDFPEMLGGGKVQAA